MLLDAETFDYTFHLKAGEGFKIAVHHHLGKDKDMLMDSFQNCLLSIFLLYIIESETVLINLLVQINQY